MIRQPETSVFVETSLNPRLAELLRKLHHAEIMASGPHRRPAFRITREVIGAALALSVPAHQVADCLGITVGTLRNRTARTDSLIHAKTIEQLTGLSPADINRESQAELRPAQEDNGITGYRVAHLVRALLAMPIAQCP